MSRSDGQGWVYRKAGHGESGHGASDRGASGRKALGHGEGFSLVEAMVALAITALTMTTGMSLLAQQSDVNRRMHAHLEATRAIETTLENLRAGVLPLESGPVRLPTAAQKSEAMVVWLEVDRKTEPAGLAEVLVEARYVVGPRTLSRGIRTMVWTSQ